MKYTSTSGREYKLTILKLWPDFGNGSEYWQSTGLIEIEHEGKSMHYRRENWSTRSADGYEEEGDLEEVVHEEDCEEMRDWLCDTINELNAIALGPMTRALEDFITNTNQEVGA